MKTERIIEILATAVYYSKWVLLFTGLIAPIYLFILGVDLSRAGWGYTLIYFLGLCCWAGILVVCLWHLIFFVDKAFQWAKENKTKTTLTEIFEQNKKAIKKIKNNFKPIEKEV